MVLNTDEAVRQLREMIEGRKENYNRVLTRDEQKSLDADSFGYLLGLYRIGTINHVKLESLIDSCIAIAVNNREMLKLEKTKRIVNILLFFDNALEKVGEIVPFLGILDDGYENDIVN